MGVVSMRAGGRSYKGVGQGMGQGQVQSVGQGVGQGIRQEYLT